MKGLNDNQKTEVAKSELKSRNLVTIYLDDQPLRLLENDTLKTLEINGETYVAGMVKRGDVRTNMEGTSEKVEITISNIWQDISSIIANEGDTLTNRKCKVETVIFDGDTETIIGQPIQLFEGYINNIELTAVYFKFEVERVLGGYATVSPNSTYDVNCQCKKFKDERCRYAGSATSCDKSLKRCIALDNIENFYGFPSIPQEMVIR